jgi:hypothetical protein
MAMTIKSSEGAHTRRINNFRQVYRCDTFDKLYKYMKLRRRRESADCPTSSPVHWLGVYAHYS